jgi:hypothetical protein
MLSNKYIKNKTIKIWGATAPFGLIQFYFLFSGKELARIGGQNGGRDNY